jgi:hypothetical protein
VAKCDDKYFQEDTIVEEDRETDDANTMCWFHKLVEDMNRFQEDI